ncbi:pentapeptide repeat-containing protein [Paenibacillus gorillae]|uniref:pentapeptide repeat-containing protein n=1 Tax=Paenibacillus gorillae TaxID=1243662 RepID=UPI0004B286CD|nr:pentapeptide repeat-containing protein [Paenibacillus gorillae]
MIQKHTLQHFMEQVVDPSRTTVLLALEMMFQEHREAFEESFLASFRQICRDLQEQQRTGVKAKIGYITYSMLRTEIAEGRFGYLVEATDRHWFLDRHPCRYEYEADWALRAFKLLEEELEKGSVNYPAVLTRIKLEKLLLQEARYIHAYVVALLRFVMPRAVQLPEFQALQLEEEFEVRAGEYMDASEAVYKSYQRTRDAVEIREWLEEKNEHDYMHEAFDDLDLSGGDYSGTDFRYSSFNNNDLAQSRFNRCILVGTRWKGSMLAGVDFSESLLVGADYSNCNLQASLFRRVEGVATRPESLVLFAPGTEPPNFQSCSLAGADLSESFLSGSDFTGANLENASFQQTLLDGANFIGANLKNTDFTGASLEGALFSREVVPSLHLSEEQQKEIYVEWPNEGVMP